MNVACARPVAAVLSPRSPYFGAVLTGPLRMPARNTSVLGRSSYIPPQRRRLALSASQAQSRIFETPVFLASPPNSGSDSIDNLPPSNGAGGNGSGDDDGIKRDELLSRTDLANIFRDYITHTRKGKGPILIIGNHLNLLDAVTDQLHYIQDVSSILEEKLSDFEAEDLLDVVHFLAKTVDFKIEYITFGRGDEHDGLYGANVLKSIFRLAVKLERRLLEAGGVKYRPAIKIADIHSVYARKGLYFYALGERAEEFSKPLFLISTVLHLADVARRYEQVDQMGSSTFAMSYMRDVKDYFSLPREEGMDWVKERLGQIINDNVLLIVTTREDPDVFELMMNDFDKSWNDFTIGLYLYSPYIFEEIAETLKTYGFKDIAARYKDRAKEEREIAKKLGLAQ